MRRKLASIVLLFAWVATGCPQLLSDEFEVVPGTSSDASLGGTGGTDGGGAGGSGGISGGGADAGEAGPCSFCTPTQTCCDDECVNIENDPAHCGACGQGCPGTTCDGTCTGTCQLGFLDCDQNVATGCEANAVSDPDNCGSCGAKCAFDQTCDAGKCICPPGTRNCDGDLDTGCETLSDTDPTNCGACGKTCGANQECASGICGCAPGFADCNADADDGCEITLGTNESHCGVCNNDCGLNGACSAGQCGCTPDFSNCDATPGCETAKNDPLHCGSCNTPCSGATPNCDGTSCVATCPVGETKCGGSCADLNSDPLHCGSCNSPVGSNQVCAGGNPTCVTGFGDCTAALPGCETDVTSDTNHCGTCATQCNPGQICNASSCECAASTPIDCGSECRECCGPSDCTDPNACTTDTCSAAGKCEHAACATGTSCCSLGCFECCTDAECTASGQVCSGNQCVTPTCTAPEILCAGQCVNTTNNAQNCGGCGLSCGIGRSCSGGNCTPKWMPTSTAGAPSARSRAALAVLGSSGQLFIWGGVNAAGASLDTGAIYDVTTDSWTPIVNDANTPSPRVFATAVWTGQKVFVYGGGDSVGGSVDYANGALYDPVSKSWSSVSPLAAPSGRRAPYLTWTGSNVLLFAGFFASGAPALGTYLYDPQGESWTPAPTTNQPVARLAPTVAWTGSDFYVFGGYVGGSSTDELRRYTPGGGWTLLAAGPSKRYGAFGGFDGASFVVWGGRKPPQNTTYDDGKSYDAAWVNMQIASIAKRFAPHREHGWSARVSNQNTILVGGISETDGILKDGAIYDAVTKTWSSVSAWASGEDHRFGVGGLAGGELVIWGGLHGTAPTATGDRYRP